jgi:hypothetical protein
MAFAFNPITGKLDLVGTGGGSATTDASLLTSGTLALARLDPLVARDDLNNNFTSGQTITAAANTSALTASYSVTGANTTPLLDLSGSWNTTGIARGILLNITDTASAATSRLLDLQVGGTSRFVVEKGCFARFTTDGSSNPAIYFAATAQGFRYSASTGLTYQISGQNAFTWNQSVQFRIRSDGSFGFTSSTDSTGTIDTILARDAANTLALRNGGTAGTPVPQNFRIYNYTDASLTNFERGFMRWNSNTLEIGTEAGGTGTPRALIINSSNLTIQTAGLFAASFSYYNGTVITGPVQVRNQANQNAWLIADNNNILGIRNGTNAQTCNIYNTFTSASVFERLKIAATSTRNQIISESTGGTVRPLEMSFFSSASDPATTDITSGAFGVWKNTGSGTVRIWVNDGGTMKSVALA